MWNLGIKKNQSGVNPYCPDTLFDGLFILLMSLKTPLEIPVTFQKTMKGYGTSDGSGTYLIIRRFLILGPPCRLKSPPNLRILPITFPFCFYFARNSIFFQAKAIYQGAHS